MLKMEKEYNELYGDVPIDSLERIDYLLENKNLKNVGITAGASTPDWIITEVVKIMEGL